MRRGEIAEKGVLFYEGNLANPEPTSTPEHAKPVLQIEGSEYAGLSGNEKRQVHKFVYNNYAHKQTDGSSKVNADLEYYDQIERTINDKKSVRKMTFRKLQELKAELIVGRSNARTNNEWIRQLPKIESAFVRGKQWESETADSMIDRREKPEVKTSIKKQNRGLKRLSFVDQAEL